MNFGRTPQSDCEWLVIAWACPRLQHVHGCWEWEQPASVSHLFVHTPSTSVLGGTDQRLPGSNGPQCSIIPIFLIFALLPLPTDRMDHWQSRRVRERGNMLRETAGSTRMLTHSLSFTIPHMHILMLSVKKPCPYRNVKRENVINSNKNTLWLWLEKFGSYTCKLDSDKHDQINTTVSVNQPLFAFVIGSDTELKKKKTLQCKETLRRERTLVAGSFRVQA